jgi:hypothetical protein
MRVRSAGGQQGDASVTSAGRKSRWAKVIAAWSGLALVFVFTIAVAWATLDECFDYNRPCGMAYAAIRATAKSLLVRPARETGTITSHDNQPAALKAP